MDIWARLVGRSPSKRSEESPQQRLIRFKRAHDNLQTIWRRNNASSSYVTSPDKVYGALQDIQQILHAETQAPAPHLSARHVSTFHVYSTISQLAAIYPDEDIILETIEIFRILLDAEEGAFISDRGFADALVGFVSTTSSTALPVDTEIRVVELLFTISNKLKSQPELLPAWFRPSRSVGVRPVKGQDVRLVREEFLLFYMILDYVHHDGRTGDFARLGLLFLIEVASSTPSLEQWIIESDLATLMASGLGALYSQLSRKLVIAFEKDSQTPLLNLIEEARPKTPDDAEKTTSPGFASHLTTFLSYLVFWQDVLDHCSSPDIVQSLLDHFKFLFLQQLLYPSLIESSDRDGGSSVAVLWYLKCIIESINHPVLTRLTFQYLFAVPEDIGDDMSPPKPSTLARRRRSLSLIASLAKGTENPQPDLFNLHDLVLGSLQSQNQQTVYATIGLVRTITCVQAQYEAASRSLPTLSQRKRRNDIRQQAKRDTMRMYHIVEKLANEEVLRTSYEVHRIDAQNKLEGQLSSMILATWPGAKQHGAKLDDETDHMLADMSMAILNDDVLSTLFRLLRNFFWNDVQTNLSLTGLFAQLASSIQRPLDDWLIIKHDTAPTSPMEPNSPVDAEMNTSSPNRTHFMPMLLSLSDEIDRMVNKIPLFHDRLAEHRTYLTSPPYDLSPKTSPSQSPRKTPVKIKDLSTPRASTSKRPRGRNPAPTGSPTRSFRQLGSPASTLSQFNRAVSPSPLRISESTAMAGPVFSSAHEETLKGTYRLEDCGRNQSIALNETSKGLEMAGEKSGRDVPIGHVLTCCVILQEFLLELAALVEGRAGLEGEVGSDQDD